MSFSREVCEAKAGTRPYAEVIGDPIAHSKSPLIHGFWLEQLGVDAEYRATRVTADELPAYLAARRADPAWRGCNVTIPHKLAALDHVADPERVRDGIGAINLVTRDGEGALVGSNTDAAGFFAPIAGRDWTGAWVAVVGAGGAARAVLWALARARVGQVTVINRDPAKAATLLDRFGLTGEALPLDASLPAAALLVNASALGMTGQPPLTLDVAPLPEDALVYDLVYAPLETGLLAAARAHGLAALDGLAMLIAQAALGFERLFGHAPPRGRDQELRARLVG